MPIVMETRSSDSPYIEKVWRSWSDDISSFLSVAVFQWDFVVWTHQGKTQANIEGPATRACRAPVPEYAEFFGIVFRPEVFMPGLPGRQLINRSVALPDASGRSFWLMSDSWQFPDYENAEIFVNRLARQGVIDRDPVVAAALQRQESAVSLRSVQRRFLHTTGLNHRTMLQIERARRAALRLREGTSILDTVYETGYFDQSHLTKSLQTYIGQTPAQLMDPASHEQLSLLYKTDALP